MNVDSEDYSEGEQEGEESLAHDENEHNVNTSTESPVQKLACDRCRNRKVRCDRRDPCSKCVRMKAKCTYTAQKPMRQKRPRILVSNQYERKIDEISRKIDTICKLFDNEQSLPTPQESSVRHISRHGSRATTPATSSPGTTTKKPRTEDLPPPEPEYEGESALSAHAAFATRFLQTAVDKDRSMSMPPETASTLHDLTRTAEGRPKEGESLHDQFPNATHPSWGSATSKMAMPPPQIIFAGLRMAREHPRVRYAWTFEFESVEHFQDYFLSVFGSSQPTLAEKIILFAGLYPLFSECACIVEKQPLKDEFKAQAALCQDNLETLLAGLPFHLPSTYDYVLALTLAAGYSVEKCRPILAWNFNCTAARMSQALGFHKVALQETRPSEAMRRRSRVFGIIYMTDKMLSLRLGRGSVIRDEEITTDHRTMLKWANTAPKKFPPGWVSFAQMQGLVYDRLYSPEALQQPAHVREIRAWELSGKLHEILNEECEIKAAFESELHASIGDRLWALMMRSDKVAQLALRCLIHRNIPPPAGSGASFSDECISIAREALTQHGMCMEELVHEESSFLEMYFTWALLTSPFVPFIVLLCNVVETYNLADLKLLGTMIVSIEGIHETMPLISKQLRLFKPLFEVASKFVEAKTAPVPQEGSFDTFFQEVNMDISFDAALLSTFSQGRPPDLPSAAPYMDTSIIGVWSYLDSPYPG